MVVTAQDPSEPDPIAVLEGIDRRLAGINASLDGIAVRQQTLGERDPAPLLEAQTREVGRLADKVTILTRSPALELTPQRVQGAIEQAVREGRQDDTQVFAAAAKRLIDASATLGRQTIGLTDARRWLWWAAGAVGAALLLGMILGDTVPGIVDRAMPADWYWPEAAAADVMHADAWTAGQRLLQAADEKAWRAQQQASAIVAANRFALSECSTRAANARTPVSCTIQIDLATANKRQLEMLMPLSANPD